MYNFIIRVFFFSKSKGFFGVFRTHPMNSKITLFTAKILLAGWMAKAHRCKSVLQEFQPRTINNLHPLFAMSNIIKTGSTPCRFCNRQTNVTASPVHPLARARKYNYKIPFAHGLHVVLRFLFPRNELTNFLRKFRFRGETRALVGPDISNVNAITVRTLGFSLAVSRVLDAEHLINNGHYITALYTTTLYDEPIDGNGSISRAQRNLCKLIMVNEIDLTSLPPAVRRGNDETNIRSLTIKKKKIKDTKKYFRICESIRQRLAYAHIYIYMIRANLCGYL